MEKQTYSMDKARQALKLGLPVFVAHPYEADAPIKDLAELEQAKGHLFIIKNKGE